MFKSIAIAALALGLAAPADAETYYDANGAYLGSAYTNGGMTTIYDANGDYAGKSYDNGGMSTHYDAKGNFLGFSYR